MRFIELSTEIGKMTEVSELPGEVKELITDDNTSVMVIDYPINDTKNLILSPTLDWDMGEENITRSIINLKPVVSVGVFSGPSCDIYEKINKEEKGWILYRLIEKTILFKI